MGRSLRSLAEPKNRCAMRAETQHEILVNWPETARRQGANPAWQPRGRDKNRLTPLSIQANSGHIRAPVPRGAGMAQKWRRRRPATSRGQGAPAIAVSPLAPKSFADSAAAGGRAAGHRRRPASATRTGPTCCSRFWRREPRSRACSPNPRRPRRRSTGARRNSKAGSARALVVNSGNANAFTGKAGYRGRAPDRRIRGRRRRLPRAGSVPGLDRRDRRAAAGGQDHAHAGRRSPRRARPAAGAPRPKPS